MTATSVEKANGTPVASHAEPRFDPRALAEAEAIRTEANARAEALRIEAAGKAEAEKILAAEQAEQLRLENEKQRLTVQRNELRFQREQAAELARIAEAKTKQEAAERQARAAREQEAAETKAQQAAAAEVAAADDKWRRYALNFYRVCAVVALPVQLNAFYDPDALWLMAAPLMLEGGAWVVQKGAASAVANGRPAWHYRLISWLLAFIAAGINLWHGLAAFDPATALGTAFASIAGPGVWDLHENGRIRKRDGVPTRRERRAVKKEAERLAAEQAEKELREAERQAYKEKAAREAAERLDAMRREQFPKVHAHAWKLVADYGETAITPAIWKQAKLDVEGALPGESADVIRMRNAATARVEAAREKRSVNGSTQQVASQVPGPKKPRIYNPPARRGKRTKGDVKFTPAAARQASIAARNAAAKKDQS